MSFKDRLGDFPRLETDRLLLREIEPTRDAAPRHRILSDDQVMAYVPEAMCSRLRGEPTAWHDNRQQATKPNDGAAGADCVISRHSWVAGAKRSVPPFPLGHGPTGLSPSHPEEHPRNPL